MTRCYHTFQIAPLSRSPCAESASRSGVWFVRRTLHTRRQPHAGNCVASPGLVLVNTEKLLRPCVQIIHSHRHFCAFVCIHVFKPRNTTPVRVESRGRGRANPRRTVCVFSAPLSAVYRFGTRTRPNEHLR